MTKAEQVRLVTWRSKIFTLSAGGFGVKAIAKLLNADGCESPPQRGRSQTWAPSSVREVLHRDLYRGLITWNKTRKRDRRAYTARLHVPPPSGSRCRHRSFASSIRSSGTVHTAGSMPPVQSTSETISTIGGVFGARG